MAKYYYENDKNISERYISVPQDWAELKQLVDRYTKRSKNSKNLGDKAMYDAVVSKLTSTYVEYENIKGELYEPAKAYLNSKSRDVNERIALYKNAESLMKKYKNDGNIGMTAFYKAIMENIHIDAEDTYNYAGDKKVKIEELDLQSIKESKKKKDGTGFFKTPENLKDNLRRFEDKYDLGDVSQTALEYLGEITLDNLITALESTTRISSGILSVPENIAKFGAGLEAELHESLGWYDSADRIRKNIIDDDLSIRGIIGINKANEILDKNSFTGEMADSVLEAIGQAGGQMAIGSALPIKAIKLPHIKVPTTAVLSGLGSGIHEAYKKLDGIKNPTWRDKLQGAIHVIGSGTIEGISEGIFDIAGIGGSTFADDVLSKNVNAAKTEFGKRLAAIKVAGGFEAAEEFISYFGNWALDNGLVDRVGNIDYSKEWDWKEVIKEMTTAFLSSGITSGFLNNTNISNTYINSINKNKEMLGRELTKDETEYIRKQVVDDVLLQENLGIFNEPQYSKNYEVEKAERKNTINEISKLHKELMSNLDAQSKTIESLQLMEEIVSKIPNLTLEVDYKLPKVFNGMRTKIGKDGSRAIVINPNAQNIEKVFIHEFVHELKSRDIDSYNDILNYIKTEIKSEEEFETLKASKQEIYAKAYKQQKKNMNGLDVEEETVCEIVGEMLGTKETLNKLAKDKPTLIERIYNWIVDVLFDGKHTGKSLSERISERKLGKESKVLFEKIDNAYQIAKGLNKDNSSEEKFNINSEEKVDIGSEIGYDIENYVNKTAKSTSSLYIKSTEIFDFKNGVYFSRNGLNYMFNTYRINQALDEDGTVEQSGLHAKCYGDYCYLYKKHGHNDYTYYCILSIKGNEDIISMIYKKEKRGEFIDGEYEQGLGDLNRNIIYVVKRNRNGNGSSNNDEKTRTYEYDVGLDRNKVSKRRAIDNGRSGVQSRGNIGNTEKHSVNETELEKSSSIFIPQNTIMSKEYYEELENYVRDYIRQKMKSKRNYVFTYNEIESIIEEPTYFLSEERQKERNIADDKYDVSELEEEEYYILTDIISDELKKQNYYREFDSELGQEVWKRHKPNKETYDVNEEEVSKEDTKQNLIKEKQREVKEQLYKELYKKGNTKIINEYSKKISTLMINNELTDTKLGTLLKEVVDKTIRENPDAPKKLNEEAYSYTINILKEAIHQLKDRTMLAEGEAIRSWTDTAKKNDLINSSIDLKDMRYKILSNKSLVDIARSEWQNTNNYSKTFIEKVENGLRIEPKNIVKAEFEIQELLKTKDFKKAEELIIAVTITGTEIGQTVQAMSIINRLTPEGTLMKVQMIINRTNAKLRNEKIKKGVKPVLGKKPITIETEEKLYHIKV